MIRVLFWILVLAGPVLCAVAGGVTAHLAERRHLRRAVTDARADGYSEGVHWALDNLVHPGPQMIITPDGQLEPDLEGWEPWANVHAASTAAMEAIGAQVDAARASLNLP